ncbi:dihydroorotase [Bernardetia sp.]|uniref:dihydroorotase n=1 Tax=Bernardetia sp. TaxID=1937974 RepID=UPI0025C158FF|nr:dihydroorotase [Bernardetia sp.]
MQLEKSSAYWLPNVKILDTNYNSDTAYCIGISEKKITHIVEYSSDIQAPKNYEVLECEGACVSVGWCDMRALVTEPGMEHRETLASASKAASKGGFTQVAILPNTQPTIENKENIYFLEQQNRKSSSNVEFLAISALTHKTEGKEMTQMHDLHKAGAVAFSDGLKNISHTGVLMRTLQYAQAFDGLIMQLPSDENLSTGHMHEGTTSTRLGLKGLPTIAEEMMIQRDLEILRYTGGKLHFSTISSARSVDLIRKAKAEGLNVTCDIAAYQLSFLDEDLAKNEFIFDTNLKVFPPFRNLSDKNAILEGLQDNTIDVIVSNHIPFDEECKKLEFDLADFGIINFQTAFAAIRKQTENLLSLEELIQKMTINPRKILKLKQPQIKEGEKANLTVFYPDEEWTFTKKMNASKSDNSPFFDLENHLKGKVVATFS